MKTVLSIVILLGWITIIVGLYSVRHNTPMPVPVSTVVHIGGDEHMVILRIDNFVLGAFVDGTLCYGTYEPRTAQCKPAVPKPEIQ
jgi:hypothetical protein